jgi:hypothetical protein
MKKYTLIVLVMVLALSAFFLGGSFTQATAKEPKILEFSTMVGVPRPYTGAANAIRGVPGGGLPWKIVGSAEGELKANGKLEITVRGLVLAEGANIDKNPITNFRAIVSCLSNPSGAATTVNVSTGLFPADLAGNSKIEATLSLPSPCIAPIIFVTSPGGAWFAATGQ